jgi:predicted nucleic acid-binding protein
MAAKVFFDANVLLDFLLKRKQYDQSKKLIQIVESGAIRVYVRLLSFILFLIGLVNNIPKVLQNKYSLSY